MKRNQFLQSTAALAAASLIPITVLAKPITTNKPSSGIITTTQSLTANGRGDPAYDKYNPGVYLFNPTTGKLCGVAPIKNCFYNIDKISFIVDDLVVLTPEPENFNLLVKYEHPYYGYYKNIHIKNYQKRQDMALHRLFTGNVTLAL